MKDCMDNMEIKKTRLFASLIFLAAMVILSYSAAPGVGFHDTGEFALAAKSAGIPHPPGAPSWTIPAWIFLKIGGFDESARGTNLFSAFCGALTLSLFFLLICRFSRKIFPETPSTIVLFSGFSGVLILFSSPAFLQQSMNTEQYTLLLLFLCILILSLDKMTECGNNIDIYALLSGIIWGLSMGNHPSQIALVLFVIWGTCKTVKSSEKKSSKFSLKIILLISAGAIAGLLAYIWVPLRSASDPLMDFGNPETPRRFLWSLLREQWSKRSLFDAPRGFVMEWMKSFDFITQLSLPGFLLSLSGIIVLWKKGRDLIWMLLLITIPYGAVMLLGHMKQANIDAAYIRFYGVTEWHLPLYILLAMTGGVALNMVYRTPSRFRPLILVTVSITLLLVSTFSIYRNSFRNWTAPSQYFSDIATPLPENSLILANTDNMIFTSGYFIYTKKERGLWLAADSPRIDDFISENGWNESRRRTYLAEKIPVKNFRIMNVPALSEEQVTGSPLLLEYTSSMKSMHEYLLPRGYLFEVKNSPVSIHEVLASEKDWLSKYPEIVKFPSGSEHPWESEARSLLHQSRTAFFVKWELWDQAERSCRKSLSWTPENGQLWYVYGEILEQLQSTGDAAEAYEKAVHYSRYLEGPRTNLGIIYAKRGQFEEAEKLFREELAMFPDSVEARMNLKVLEQNRSD